MKTTSKITAILIVAFITMSAATGLAQRGQGMMGKGMPGERMQRAQQCTQMIPDLTEQQQEQIQELRVDQIKQMTSFRNELSEKRARLRTLETQDDPDMSAINSVIEEMGNIRTDLHKARAEHRQEIRELLNEEQRTFFDSRMMQRSGKGAGRRGGYNSGSGMRPGRGIQR